MKHPITAIEFQWDEHNERELAAHDIRPAQVEQVFFDANPQWAPNKKSAAGTWLMTGPDLGGRMLTISIMWADEDERILRAITGWRVR